MVDYNKKVLLLNASHNDEGLLLSLKRLGCYIITTGNNEKLEGHEFSNEYVYGDFSDLNAMLNLAIEKEVDAVCPCGNDFGVKTAAYVSEKLGFKGQDNYETTLIIHDKDKFKEFCNKHKEINTPKSVPFDNVLDAKQYAMDTIKYPVIVKAVDLSAGNGIIKANNREELIKNIEYSFNTSRAKRILIEDFVEGTLHGFCAFLVNKKVKVYSSDNEYCIINPYRVDSYTVPCSVIDEVKDDLIRQVEFIAKELNLVDGIFHLQFIYSGGKAYIIECMRRVIGNMYSTIVNHYNWGFDWDYFEAKAKCDYPLDDFPEVVGQKGYYAFRALIAKKNGIFNGFDVDKKYVNNIYYCKMLHNKGHEITNHLSEPMGMLFFKFDTKEEINDFIYKDYDMLKINLK